MGKGKNGFYNLYIKRLLDVIFSLLALIALSPLLLILVAIGSLIMGGNPFFLQERPGKNGKVFKIIKFRTMTNKKDMKGNFLPADDRLVPYGKFLRSTSIDELPELINILIGDMSFIGPRPLLVKYLPLYNEHQKRRHEIRPGLTGYAQANGRNTVTWEERFDMDVWYLENVSFRVDFKILIETIKVIILREGITSADAGESFMDEFKGSKGGILK